SAGFVEEGWRWWNRKGIACQKQPSPCRHVKLVVTLGPPQEVDGPHGHDETNGTPHADRGECFDDIELPPRKYIVAHRIRQPQAWHIKQRVEQDETVKCPEIRHIRCSN